MNNILSLVSVFVLLSAMFVTNFNVHLIDAKEVFLSDDIVIGDNETFEIKDCEYTQTGNIIVKDNGTLIIRNATLILTEYDWLRSYNITIENQGNLTAVGSLIEGEALMNNIYFFDNAVVKMRNVIVENDVYLNPYNNSLINISDSTIKTNFYIRDNSSVHTMNSHFLEYTCPRVYDSSSLWVSDTVLDHKIYSYGSSNVKVQHSIMDTYMDCHDHSSIIIYDSSILNGGILCDDHVKVEIWNSSSEDITMYGQSSAKVFNSTIGYVGGLATGLLSHDYSSIEVLNSDISEAESEHFSSILLRNSTIGWSLNARDMSAINLLNTTYGVISVEDYAVVNVKWYLTVYTALDGMILSNATVEVYFAHNDSLAQSGFSNADGIISFLLPEKVIQADETMFLGNYTIMVTYETESKTENIVLNSSRQMTVVIPEFPSILILPLLAISTLLAVILQRRNTRRREKMYNSNLISSQEGSLEKR